MYPDSIQLAHAQIYRGGGTARYLRNETEECAFKINDKFRVLEFRFHLDSAGGGTTEILVRIGLDDLPLIKRGIDALQNLEINRLRKRITELEAKLSPPIPSIPPKT